MSGMKAEKGEVLFTEGESGEVMYVIRTGTVKVSITSHGTERVLARLGAGEIVGEMALLNSSPRTATATVEEDAELVAVDAYTFEDMIIGNTEIALRLIRKLARRLDAADSMISLLMHRDPSARFSLGVNRAARLYGVEHEQGVLVPFSVPELADQVGVTEAEAEKVMHKLSSGGIAKPVGNDIILRDPDKMSKFVEFLRNRPVDAKSDG